MEEFESFADLLDEETTDTSSDPVITLDSEPMFVALLRQAVGQIWGQDLVMNDFVNYVAPPLSDLLGHVSAKGGNFAAEMKALGKDTERYDFDQSMRAHLINGLFPTLHVAKNLQAWKVPQFKYYDDVARRLFIAGFILHDWLKFPGIEEELNIAGFSHADSIGPLQLPLVENLFIDWCKQLGLESFLNVLGGSNSVLHDLIYIACNTQLRWGTLHNLSQLPRLRPEYSAKRNLCEQLSRLADYLTYVARTPRNVATDSSIRTVISQLSNRTAYFTYHHLADNRGLLGNFIHQSCLEALKNDSRVPILYAPSGVVYLVTKEAVPPPSVVTIAEAIVTKIKVRLRQELIQKLSGFNRDGKGLKYAGYYRLFFDLPAMLHLGAKATFSIIHETKKPSAGKRFEKMRTWLETDLELPDDSRVDQLAEWCYFAEKLIATEYIQFDIAEVLLKEMELSHLRTEFDTVPRDNRAGGVGYHWYFAAGHFLKGPGRGLDPTAWRNKVDELTKKLIIALPQTQSVISQVGQIDNWQDLKTYISQNLTVGELNEPMKMTQNIYAVELHRYHNAKRKGRGTTSVCALCSSPFEIGKQQEAAVLFAPQVYSNKLLLHGSNAIRDICSICSLEMMLRQLLMNPGKASGGNFEGQRIRYLYFYPTYFFTPETQQIIKQVYENLTKPSFTELRKQLITGQGLTTSVHLTPTILQRLKPFLLSPNPAKNRDIRFSENEPIMFYFLGVQPPGRDAKDAEAWIHPAFLALLLPLCLDVKVVASESQLPLLREADELSETTFLDAPHAFVKYLTQKQQTHELQTLAEQSRFNIDEILSTLQRLMVAYLIQIDANSGMGRTGFDYRWQDIPALARNLATSPLYTFYYLKKWQRKEKLDNLPVGKVHLYLDYINYLDERNQVMSHARKLTELYRRFYWAKGSKPNSILRPIAITAETLLTADRRMFKDQAALEEVVFGTLRRRINKLQSDNLARYPEGSNYEEREAAMREFTTYFVKTIYFDEFKEDVSALRGRQLNLLSNACEAIYREENAKYWSERGKPAPVEEEG